MKKIVYIMPAILLIAGSCTSQMYLGSSGDDLYYRPSQARKAAVAQTGVAQEKKAATADIFSGDTLIADNFTEDTLYNDNANQYADASNSNVIPTTEGNVYVYNNYGYPYYDQAFLFDTPFTYDLYSPMGWWYTYSWYSPYYSWYSPWYSPYYWGASWYSPYNSWYYGYGYGYYPYDYYYGGGYYNHDHHWNNLPVARRSGSSSLTGNSYAAGNSGLRSNYARRSPSNTMASSGRYSTTSVKRDNVNTVSRTTYSGTTQNPGYERRTAQGGTQNNVRPDYQTQTRSYTPSYNTPRMSSKPAYNNSRTGSSSSSSYSNNTRVSSGNSGSRVQYSSPGRASSTSITHSSSPSYSGGSSGGSRGSSVSSSSSSSSSFKSSSSSGGNSGGGGGRRR